MAGPVPGRLIDLDAVDVLGGEPFTPDDVVRRGTWVCAACGQRRALEGSWQVTIRNRHGMSLERPVVVCQDCYAPLAQRATW